MSEIQNKFGQILITPEEYLKLLPPSSFNNSRSTLKRWIVGAQKGDGDEGNYYVKQLTDMGFVGDLRTGADWGNEPEKHNFD